jgi:hypothetical protein
LRVAKNSQFAYLLGKQGRQHALASFSLSAMLDKTEQLYDSFGLTVFPK